MIDNSLSNFFSSNSLQPLGNPLGAQAPNINFGSNNNGINLNTPTYDSFGGLYDSNKGLNFQGLGDLAGFGTNIFAAYLANQANNDQRKALNFQIDSATKGFNNNVSQIQGELNDRAARRAADNAAGGLTTVTGPAPQLQGIGSFGANQNAPLANGQPILQQPLPTPQLQNFGTGG